MARIIDRRKQAMGGGSKRSISQIKNIAIHYSATESGNTAAFENHWRNNNGWNTGGYHEVILTNGDVEINYDPNVISNGVGGQNTRMYNMCYVGKGVPNKAQLKTLTERANYNRKRFGLSIGAVNGHREYKGQSTSCPALNMGDFRKALAAAGSVNKSKERPITQAKPASAKAGAKLKVDGKWGSATTRELQRALGTTADGVISSQPRNSVTQALYGGVTFGSKGSPMVRALQRKVGARVDGKLGAETIRKLQAYLGTVRDGKLSRPSLVVKEMQRRLNNGKF